MAGAFDRASGRVSIDASVHELYKQLTGEKNPEEAPFATMKDLFMLAACLGFTHQQRKPLGKREQPFHYSQLSKSEDIPILKAIAIATTGDVAILADPDKIVGIAEEYANAGFHEIRSIVNDNGGSSLWKIISLIRT